MTLTANDKRVLESVEDIQQRYDGFGPHGPSDWVAIKRLKAAGLIVCIGFGSCEDCDTPSHRLEMHEGPIYVTAEHAAKTLRLAQ